MVRVSQLNFKRKLTYMLSLEQLYRLDFAMPTTLDLASPRLMNDPLARLCYFSLCSIVYIYLHHSRTLADTLTLQERLASLDCDPARVDLDTLRSTATVMERKRSADRQKECQCTYACGSTTRFSNWYISP